jgi:hypothetical protein
MRRVIPFAHPASYWGRSGWATSKAVDLIDTAEFIGGYEGALLYVKITPINSRGPASCEIHIPVADLKQFILQLIDFLPEEEHALLRKGVIAKTMNLGQSGGDGYLDVLVSPPGVGEPKLGDKL